MNYMHLLRAIFLVFAFTSTTQAMGIDVDLHTAANRAYVDAVAGDGKGWSNQGPDNSLNWGKHGAWFYGGMLFQILGTKENGEHQVLVFDSKNDPTGLNQVEVPVSEAGAPAIGRNLYLLHTACGLPPGDTSLVATVSVRCDSGRTVDFPIRAGTEVADWQNPVDQPNAVVAYQENHATGPVGVYLTRLVVPKDAGVPVAVNFRTAGDGQWIVLAASLTDHDPLVNVGNSWAPSLGQGWKAADMDDLEVRPGSALDFSTVFPNSGKVGDNGFVIVSSKGDLAFEKKPDESVRFLCCSMIQEFPDTSTPDQIDQFAEQVARGGYNMLRPHYLDAWLGLKGATPTINPKALDNWEHLVASLKVRGIYLFLDVTTLLPDVKLPMYYDQSYRDYWKNEATTILTHVNPYTGLALKDDPIVAIGQLRNEAGLGYLMARRNPETLKAAPMMAIPFRAWLRKKYVTDQALRAAWTTNGKLPDGVPPDVTLDTVVLPTSKGFGPDATDLQLFFVDAERDLLQWMSGVVKGLGLRAPLTDINNSYSLESDLARNVLPLVDEHAYFDHPRFFRMPTDAGSSESAGNPLLRGIMYYFNLPAMRQLGCPFTVSEWGQVFWNPYRYQASFTLPVYASLQGWQMLAQFTNPIRPIVPAGYDLSKVGAEPFRLFKDPSTRAGEYMAALVFRRGDLERSPHNVELVVDPQAIAGRLSLQDAPSTVISRVALVTALGTRVPSLPGAAFRGAYHADLSLTPDATQAISTQEGASNLVLTPGSNTAEAVPAMFDKLRAAGILSADNHTDPSKGLYESDTGQILLNTQIGTIQINSPLSQGGTLLATDSGLQLPDLNAKLNGVDGAVFAGSLTQQPLASSSHILLLIITDSLNTGTRFTDKKRQVLIDNGAGPVLMRVVQADVLLHNSVPGTAHLWALSANGERVEEIPLTDANGTLSAHIDTAALHKGPTPYFEVVRAK